MWFPWTLGIPSPQEVQPRAQYQKIKWCLRMRARVELRESRADPRSVVGRVEEKIEKK